MHARAHTRAHAHTHAQAHARTRVRAHTHTHTHTHLLVATSSHQNLQYTWREIIYNHHTLLQTTICEVPENHNLKQEAGKKG